MQRARRILFVHQNFPGQFLHLAQALARRGQDVLALTVESNQRPSSIRTMRYRFAPQPFPHDDWRIAAHFADQARRGERVARAALQLKTRGYEPDIVYGHPGWGETLFLPDVWPHARHVAYAEFFYRASGQDVGFDREFAGEPNGDAVRVRARQAAQLLSLETVHHGVAPTRWQASTYPDHLRRKMSVIHDGIDTDAIRPDPTASVSLLGGSLQLRHGDEVLTFVSRNLEPYRGFHIFMRALPRILKARRALRVVIVGGDSQSYGGPPPLHPNWKEALLTELRGTIDLGRVHFVGKVPHPDFIALMQVSRAHAYLTYPFVLSWSLLEAMSAGALIIGSATPPVEEVISSGDNGLLVSFFDVEAWAETIIGALAEPERHLGLRQQARHTIVSRYDLNRLCLPAQISLLDSV